MTAVQLQGIAQDGETITVPVAMMMDKETIPQEGRFDFVDTVAIDAKDPEFRILPDSGYLVARPRVARTGIQLYRGSEVGKPQMDIVRVYRPDSEVFDKASLQTYAFKPLTNDHPPEKVTADNHGKYGVGVAANDITRDGIYVRVGTVWQDGPTIKGIQDGKVELSVGYSTDLKWESGVTPQGEAYDAIQTKIRINHIANVKAARGGDKLRVGDNAQPPSADGTTQETNDMSNVNGAPAPTIALVQMDVDGIPCQMTDVSAAAIKRRLKTLESEADDLRTQLKAQKEEGAAKASKDAETITKLTGDVASKDAEIVTLKKQVEDGKLTSDKLDAMVKDRAEMVGKAKAILGDKLVVDGKSDADIRKQVVDAKLGDAAKGWDEAQIKTSFDTLAAGVQANGSQSVADAFSGNGGGHRPGYNGQVQTKDAAYGSYDKRLAEAWKGEAPKAN
jgi:hypothetical protein